MAPTTPDKDKWDGRYEFGGAPGVVAFIVVSHIIVYYFYVCIEFFGGNLVVPHWHMMELLWAHASPTTESVTVYIAFTLYELLLALTMPGVRMKGLPIPSEGNRTLSYNCNAVASWYAILATVAGFHFSGVYPIHRIREIYGPLLTTSVIAGNAVSVAIYLGGIVTGNAIRMSGNHVYDYFMGSWLNPRLFGGRVDIKMFAEIRNSWVILFLVTLSCAAKQYEQYGYVTYSMGFMVLAHLLYVNACQKGEECIPTTWDIFYEKFGWMLIFWNFAGVPFSYCFQSLYIQTVLDGRDGFANGYVAAGAYALLLFAYYVWDTANSQKNRFRMMRQGVPSDVIKRRTFPQLPWGTIDNPRTIKGAAGELFCDGWWAWGRKIHYTADLTMAFLWGAACGFNNFIPFFYFCFFLSHLVHRAFRDDERCHKKYGKMWDEFCNRVPYIFIPYVF
eukprot:PhM_4_TR14252/c0_g1_i1/m.8664/K00223/ERG4; Delta24(24(1))-sterol reductase